MLPACLPRLSILKTSELDRFLRTSPFGTDCGTDLATLSSSSLLVADDDPFDRPRYFFWQAKRQSQRHGLNLVVVRYPRQNPRFMSILGDRQLAPALSKFIHPAQMIHDPPGMCGSRMCGQLISLSFLSLQSNFEGALLSYERALSVSAQREVRMLCLHEVGWSHVLLLQWQQAAQAFLQLKRESRWSKSFYSYLSAGTVRHHISSLAILNETETQRGNEVLESSEETYLNFPSFRPFPRARQPKGHVVVDREKERKGKKTNLEGPAD